VKGDDSAGTNHLRHELQRNNRIGKKLQNETTDHRVERFIDWKLPHIGLGEDHVVQAGIVDASSGSGDRASVAFYAYYFSSRANKPRCQHCHVTNAGTKIQDTLGFSNACLTEESFGERRQNYRLANQSLMFGIGIAERVMRGATDRWHMAENITMRDFASACPRRTVTARRRRDIPTSGNSEPPFNRDAADSGDAGRIVGQLELTATAPVYHDRLNLVSSPEVFG